MPVPLSGDYFIICGRRLKKKELKKVVQHVISIFTYRPAALLQVNVTVWDARALRNSMFVRFCLLLEFQTRNGIESPMFWKHVNKLIVHSVVWVSRSRFLRPMRMDGNFCPLGYGIVGWGRGPGAENTRTVQQLECHNSTALTSKRYSACC